MELAPRPHRRTFRLQQANGYTAEIHKLLFKWRFIVRRPETPWAFEHRFCLFGTDLATLAKAVAVGLEWDDPLSTMPTSSTSRRTEHHMTRVALRCHFGGMRVIM